MVTNQAKYVCILKALSHRVALADLELTLEHRLTSTTVQTRLTYLLT